MSDALAQDAPEAVETPERFADNDAKLAAVRRRDAAADCAFFYSVVTTGV